ncbi:MAG TPA: hypothetical protein VF510_06730 [Ktedonobacterales bacterium]
MPSPLSAQSVQVLIVLMPVLFAAGLFFALRRVRFPIPSSHYQLRTVLVTFGISTIFAVFAGWFMWWLSLYGPSSGQISYRGNGALDVLISLGIGVVLSLVITLYYRAWWAALLTLVLDPLIFISTYSLLARLAAS